MRGSEMGGDRRGARLGGRGLGREEGRRAGEEGRPGNNRERGRGSCQILSKAWL